MANLPKLWYVYDKPITIAVDVLPIIEIVDWDSDDYGVLLTAQQDPKENRFYYVTPNRKLHVDPQYPDNHGIYSTMSVYSKDLRTREYNSKYYLCEMYYIRGGEYTIALGKNALRWSKSYPTQVSTLHVMLLDDKFDKRCKKLERIIQVLSEKLNTTYYAPGMPGYLEAQAEFAANLKIIG